MTELLHQSIAKRLCEVSPAHVRAELDGEVIRKSSKRMGTGTLVDQLLFGRPDFHTIDAKLKSGPNKGKPATNLQCSEAREQAEAARERGQIPVFAEELEAARLAASRIRARMYMAHIDLEKCSIQPTLRWTSSLGVECEGTPDALEFLSSLGACDTIDLKLGFSANPKRLDDHVFDMGWDIQGAAYREAIRMNYPETEDRGAHRLVVCEPDGINAISIVPLSLAYLDIGRRRWEYAQAIWEKCQRTNVWPEYEGRPIMPTRRVHWHMGEMYA